MNEVQTLKIAAVLRNITDLMPVIPGETRWSGRYEILELFAHIRDELLEAANHEDGTMHVDDSSRFLGYVRKYSRMPGEINVVKKITADVLSHAERVL